MSSRTLKSNRFSLIALFKFSAPALRVEEKNARLIKEQLLCDARDLEPNYFYQVVANIDGDYYQEIDDDFVWRLLPAASVRVLIHEDADRDYAINALSRIAGVLSKATDWHNGTAERNALVESLGKDAKPYFEDIPF